MPTLNHAGLARAHALVSAGHVDRSAPWSFDAADGDALLGPDGDDWARYGAAHLAVNADATDDTRGHWSYPFARLVDGRLTLYRSALTAIRQRAGQEGAADVEAAAGTLLDAVDRGQDHKTSASASDGPGLRLQGSASFDFTAAPAGEPPRRPTFSIHAYTGAPMRPAGFPGPVVVDLSGVKTDRPHVPILLDHDPSQIVGQASPSVGPDGIRVSGTVTGDDAPAQKVTTHARNGFAWQASIGAKVNRAEYLKGGEAAVVNGRQVAGPMMVARSTTLQEVSFVAIGADSQTSASVAASAPATPGSPHGASEMTFEAWLQAKGFDPAALSDTMKAPLKAQYDAEIKASAGNPGTPTPATTTPPATTTVQATAPAPTLTLDQILADERSEASRVDQITALAAQAIRDRPALIDTIEHAARAAINARETTVQQFELAVLRLRANTGGGASPAVHSRGGVGAAIRGDTSVIEAAICKAGRLSSIEKHYDARTLEAADRHFKHGVGLQELLLICARENGYTGHSASDVRGVLQAAFIRADGFSTISLPGTLSNVMNKFLVDYFNGVDSAWRDVCAIRNVRDFKQVSSYSLTGDLTYEKVGPTGEIKQGTLGEAKYTNQADTYAKMLAITRQDIINDDLGALMRVPQRLGRGGALKLNDVIWTAFLAGVGSFWASGNANLLTGAGSALSASALASAVAQFRKQTDPDGKPLGVNPRVLLVPSELETTAKQLMNSQYFVAAGGGTNTQYPSANVWTGAFKVAQTPYLSNTSYTGYSTTAWFLLADPLDLPTIEVAVLNGREVPIIESAEAEFDTLGIRVRAYHDFGSSLQEQRGSVRNAGA